MGEGGWKGLGKDEIRWCGYFEAERLAALNTTASTSGGVTWVSSNGLLQSDSSNFFWDNTNTYLGIGTNVPLSKIHAVTAESKTSGDHFFFNASNGGGANDANVLRLLSGRGDAGSQLNLIQIDNSSGTRFKVNATGQTAIGSDANASGAMLNIHHSGTGSAESIRLSNIGNSGDGIYAYSSTPTRIFSIIRDDTISTGTLALGAFGGIGFNASNALPSASNYDMYLNTTGLGVGLITPLSAFHVSGGASFQGNISSYPAAGNVNAVDDLDIDFPSVTSNNATIRIFRSTNNSATNSVQILKGDGTGTIQHLFHSNGNSYVQLNTGNFGIGTNLPAKTLHVSGAICTSGANAQYFVGASGGITALITPVDLTTKSLLFSGGLLVGYG